MGRLLKPIVLLAIINDNLVDCKKCLPGSLVEMVGDHNQGDKVDGTEEEDDLHDQEEGEQGQVLGGQGEPHTEHSIAGAA